MRSEQATKRRSTELDETHVLTSDDHQTLTVDDLIQVSGKSASVESGPATKTATQTRPEPPRSTQRDFSAEIAEIEWTPPQHSATHRAAKRALDVVVSVVALFLLSPLFLLIAVAIKLGDLGPVFYEQARVGKGGRHFRFAKFRTMIRNADAMKSGLADRNNFQGDITFKLTHDPRVTKVGRLLRKTSLDELPQLWHVLTGEMTLVGPRPAVPSEVAEYSPYELRRVTVRPGLTCYWQVSGRSDLPFERQIELDLKYIEDESLWLDIVLLARTIPALLLMRGAY